MPVLVVLSSSIYPALPADNLIQFQPGHIVRGIDFSDDPLLQGRIFSYLDTQLNRHGGPNFEQIPINRPRVPIHNNNRDGAGKKPLCFNLIAPKKRIYLTSPKTAQMFIPLNKNPYTPNTQNSGWPAQADQHKGRGFFSAPTRHYSGNLMRTVSPTFNDVWSQPRLFFNSLVPQEQQFLVDAIRFENSKVKSQVVRDNVVTQLNRISNDLAKRVALVIGVDAPAPDPTFYHDNKTINLGTFGEPLKKLDGLKVGVLASVAAPSSVSDAAGLASAFAESQVDVVVVAEKIVDGVGQTYAASDATDFDAIVVSGGAESLFTNGVAPPLNQTSSTLFPSGRPLQILIDGFRFGKTVGAWGSAHGALDTAGIVTSRPGVFVADSPTSDWISDVKGGLRTFKFLDRFPVEPPIGS